MILSTGGVPGLGEVPGLGGCLVPGGGVPGGDPPGTATVAGGTHPTGMHSCSQFLPLSYHSNVITGLCSSRNWGC